MITGQALDDLKAYIAAEHPDASRMPKPWTPHALPKQLNVEGRPVWEPPVFGYNAMIGEEYDNKRAAIMKHVKNDPARATKILDIDIEWCLMAEYEGWISDITAQAAFEGDYERESFFNDLWHEVDTECGETWLAYTGLNLHIERQVDGTYKVIVMEELRQEQQTPEIILDKRGDQRSYLASLQGFDGIEWDWDKWFSHFTGWEERNRNAYNQILGSSGRATAGTLSSLAELDSRLDVAVPVALLMLVMRKENRID